MGNTKGAGLSCPHCLRSGIKSLAGLAGHVQISHPEYYQEYLASRASFPSEDTSSSSETVDARVALISKIRQLELEIKALNLEEKLAALKAKRTDRAQAR